VPAVEGWFTMDEAAPALLDVTRNGRKIPAVVAILKSEAFRNGEVHTGIVSEVLAKPKKS